MDNKHIFSKEYTEKKNAIIDCIEKTETVPVTSKRFPIKALVVAVVSCIILTSSVLAANIIGNADVNDKQQYSLRADYLPESVEEIIAIEDRADDFLEGPTGLEYTVVDLEGDDFLHIEDCEPEFKESVEYEVFTVNGHYAQIIYFPRENIPEDLDQYRDKQLIIHFEDKDHLIQVWATNLVSVEDLRKVAEGLYLETVDDGSLAIKSH